MSGHVCCFLSLIMFSTLLPASMNEYPCWGLHGSQYRTPLHNPIWLADTYLVLSYAARSSNARNEIMSGIPRRKLNICLLNNKSCMHKSSFSVGLLYAATQMLVFVAAGLEGRNSLNQTPRHRLESFVFKKLTTSSALWINLQVSFWQSCIRFGTKVR